MTQFVQVDVATPSGLLRTADVGRIADTLRRGGFAVLPTETGYMLATLATSTDAVARAFAVKSRDLAKPMHVACSSFKMASRFAIIDVRAMRILGALTPGPVTVVVQKSEMLPDSLVTLDGTVGLRIPDSPATLQVIDEIGCPVTATSLNEAGREPIEAVDANSLRRLAWPDGEVVYVVPEGGSGRRLEASTLVRTAFGKVEMLRPGPVARAAIVEVAERVGYLEAAEWT